MFKIKWGKDGAKLEGMGLNLEADDLNHLLWVTMRAVEKKKREALDREDWEERDRWEEAYELLNRVHEDE